MGDDRAAEPEARITIRGRELLLRPLTPEEIDDEWREMRCASRPRPILRTWP